LVTFVQARIHELEQECVEKELQCITLQDKMEKLCEATGIDLETPLTSQAKENDTIHNPIVSVDQQQPTGNDGDDKQKEPASQTSTDALISALEDSWSDSECISGRGSSISDFLRRESPTEESISVDESQREATPSAKPTLENEHVPASLGSLKDELMAAGEEVESDYDSGTSSDDDRGKKGGENNDALFGSKTSPSPGNDARDHEFDTSNVSLTRRSRDDHDTLSKQVFDHENVLELGENGRDVSVNDESAQSPGSPMAVFVAKFDYNPETDSPNDNPNSELAITAGEYVYVYGDVDEDGFYFGEKEDGQKGMVPSNFIEQVADDDTSGVATPEVPEDNEQEVIAQRELIAYNLSRELETVEEEEEEQLNNIMDSSRLSVESTDGGGGLGIPPPRDVKVEREFARSLLVSWEKPDNISPGKIQGYNVYVGGTLKATVKGNNKRRALLEGLNFYAGRFTVSVRTVTAGGESADSKTPNLGKGKKCSISF
jgi:hypothetical protein